MEARKEEKSSLLPYWAKFFDLLVSMYGSIVKDNKSVHLQVERKIIKETEDFICRHLFECGESIVTVITVNHSKYIESCYPLGWDINILPLQLPTVRDISFSTSVALISIIEPNTSLQTLDFQVLATSRLCIHRVAARVLPLGRFLIRLYLAPMLIKNV